LKEEIVADHVAETRSTQERNPGKAVNRTLFVAIVTLFPVLNIALGIISAQLEPFAVVLPGWVFGILNGGIVITAALIGIGTKLMANPLVNDWFRANFPALAPDSHPVIVGEVVDEGPAV
jgi:uncharacterized membrane protein